MPKTLIRLTKLSIDVGHSKEICPLPIIKYSTPGLRRDHIHGFTEFFNGCILYNR